MAVPHMLHCNVATGRLGAFQLDLKKIPRPKEIVENMSHGKAIPFDQKNEQHLAYLTKVNALLGLAQAIWGADKPPI